MEPDVEGNLWDAIAILDELKLPYALAGALTLGIYGTGRATRDADLLIDGTAESLAALRSTAGARGFSVDEAWLQYNPGIRDTNLRVLRNGVPVDFMLPRDDQDRSACLRRRQCRVGDRELWVIAPEDFILQKIKAGRPRDFDDVIPFFARQRDQLEHEYLNQWALRLGVREELDYLWSQSDRTSTP
jgi:hypothetical protein